jgi:hypothetical protein
MAKVVQARRAMTGRSIWAVAGSRALNIATVVAGLSFLYLLYGLFSGEFGNFPRGANGTGMLSPQEQSEVLAVGYFAMRAFLISFWVVTALVVAFRWQTEIPRVVMLLVGLGVFVGMPLVAWPAAQRSGGTELMTRLISTFQAAGKVAVLLCLLRLAFQAIRSMATQPARRRAEAAAHVQGRPPPEEREEKKPQRPRERTSVMRQCWELSLCTDKLRSNCPSYLSRSPCWRRRTGCQCDPYFAVRIMERVERTSRIAIGGPEAAARERIRRTAEWHASKHSDKRTCRQCPVYIDHQHYKYRALFWVAYPVTGAIVFLLLPALRGGYTWADKILTRMAASLRVLPDTRPELAPFVTSVLSADVEFLIVGAVAVLLASLVLEAFEYAIFEAMI